MTRAFALVGAIVLLVGCGQPEFCSVTYRGEPITPDRLAQRMQDDNPDCAYTVEVRHGGFSEEGRIYEVCPDRSGRRLVATLSWADMDPVWRQVPDPQDLAARRRAECDVP